MTKYMKIQGKYYHLLGMYGGNAHLGEPTDVNNEVVKSDIIWFMQPFFWHTQTPFYVRWYYDTIRFFKVDVFGRSGFRTFIKKQLLWMKHKVSGEYLCKS